VPKGRGGFSDFATFNSCKTRCKINRIVVDPDFSSGETESLPAGRQAGLK